FPLYDFSPRSPLPLQSCYLIVFRLNTHTPDSKAKSPPSPAPSDFSTPLRRDAAEMGRDCVYGGGDADGTLPEALSVTSRPPGSREAYLSAQGAALAWRKPGSRIPRIWRPITSSRQRDRGRDSRPARSRPKR